MSNTVCFVSLVELSGGPMYLDAALWWQLRIRVYVHLLLMHACTHVR
jgi:hypothetical protein